MNEMADRVATVIENHTGWDYEKGDKAWLDLACVIIAAMREPTEEMERALDDYCVEFTGFGAGNPDARLIWQKMLDAALEPTDDL